MRYTLITRSTLTLFILLVSGFAFGFAAPAQAQVRDDGRFFSAQAISRANQTIERIKREHGKSLVIETYDAIPADRQAQYRQMGADPAYKAWINDRARALNLDGVFVMITRTPGRVQAEAGRSTRDDDLPRADLDRLHQDLAGRFKNKDFDGGLQQAVEYVYRRMGENVGPEGRGAAASRSGADARGGPSAAPGGGATPPSRTGGGGSSSNSDAQRTNTTPPGAAQPGFGCGGGMGSMLCLVIAAIGAFMLIRGIFARRAAAQGQGFPPNTPYGQQGPGYGAGGGYGMGGGMGGMGQAGGGGFGRGMMGGLLGGVLGSMIFGRMSQGAGQSNMDSAGGAAPGTGEGASTTGHGGLPPTDPSTFGDAPGGGADFGGGGGSDFGGGGSDFGGSDFGGGDSGGGSDF